MSVTLVGRMYWAGDRDDEGHREYVLRTLLESNDPVDDGPESVMSYLDSIIPIGTLWTFGNDGDWAYCTPRLKVTQRGPDDEPKQQWIAEQIFSTRPMWRCQTASIESPLLEPVRFGGSFLKEKRQAFFDKDGDPLKTSSLEPVPGAQRDNSLPTVWVEQNHATNLIGTLAPMMDNLNDATMWGLPARCWKLQQATWERKWYGLCSVYYTTRLEFAANCYDDPENPGTLISGWDEQRPDVGTRVLDDGGDPSNPQDFAKYKDKRGENDSVYLDGSGNAVDDIADAAKIDCLYYPETNFFTITWLPVSL